MPESVPWMAAFSQQSGFRYEPEPDERWLRVWEPFATLRTPVRYEHALHRTFDTTAVSIARFVLAPRTGWAVGDESWIALVQDEGLTGPPAASTNDTAGVFGDLSTALGRQPTGDAAFDNVFASYAESGAALAAAITPSLRKLTLGWRTAMHFELKKGGFILAPITLSPDARSLAWLISAVAAFSEKAKKAAAGRP